MSGLFAELKRRNVIRMAGLYLVCAWLIVQVSSTLLPMFEAPAWVSRSIVIVLAVGFVPAMILSWVFELTPEGPRRETEVRHDTAAALQGARRVDRWIIVLLALALLYFGFDRFVLLPRREAALVSAATQTGAAQAAAEARRADTPRSIAVLPFDNRSGDRSQEYFADGLTDELTTALARISALKVIARSSAARYKGSDKGIAAIGNELGVGALVTGSVLRTGGRVRYTAELVAAATQTSLWADSYERDEKDVLALQAEVARAIAKAIAVRLSPAESTRLQSAGAVDPQAFEEYLRGRALWNQRSEPAVREALSHFQNATRIAPDFALGFAGMADSYIILGVWGYEPPREVMPAAKAAAQHALELDPGAGEPHASLGDILFHYDWDWAASAREHARAIELAPGFATAYHWGSETLLLTGDIDGAVARARKARELDPLSMTIRAALAQALAIQGHRDQALAELHEALALDPGFTHTRRELASLLLALGRGDEALAEARRLVSANPNFVAGLATLGLCLGATGHGDEARALLARLDGERKQHFVSALELARITAGLGDRAATLDYLEQAVAAREGFLPFLATDGEFRLLESEPRYAKIVQEIGIPRP